MTDAAGFDVVFNPSGSRDFLNLLEPFAGRFVAESSACSLADPRAELAILMWGEWEGDWRLRVGEYRVLYEIDERAHRVIIIRVRHRSEAYDRP